MNFWTLLLLVSVTVAQFVSNTQFQGSGLPLRTTGVISAPSATLKAKTGKHKKKGSKHKKNQFGQRVSSAATTTFRPGM